MITGCAVVAPPSGGPEDRNPPAIVQWFPEHDTAGVSSPLEIVLHLSEYVDRTQFAQSIALIPEAPYKLEWYGKRVIVTVDSLRPSTTYRFVIAPEYQDLHGNKARVPFTLVFSQSQHLDSCNIAGILERASKQTHYVIIQKLDTTSSMMYIVPAGGDGTFAIPALPCQEFTVAAFADSNRNQQWDDSEAGAVYWTTVQATSADHQPLVRLWITAPGQEYTPVQIRSARPLSSFRIRVTLDRPICDIQRLQIVDLSTGREVPLRAIAVLEDSTRIDLIARDPLDTATTYTLVYRSPTDNKHAVPDSIGITIRGMIAHDSIALSLSAIVPARDTTFDSPLLPTLTLQWTDALAQLPTIMLIDLLSNDTLPLRIRQPHGAAIVVSPRDSLQSRRTYQWRVFLGQAQSWNGASSTDTSVLYRTIHTIDLTEYGTIAGVVLDSCCHCPSIRVIARHPNGSIISSVVADSTGRFMFAYLPEGTWLLDAFCDTNGNGRYDGGSLHPLVRGERVAERAVTTSVKARWQTDGVVLRLLQR